MDRNVTLQQNSFLEIKDLAIASYLYSTNQVKLVGKRRLPSREVFFQFSPKNKAEELVNQYWNSEALPIQPKQLFSAQRDLKDIIFGG